jgi:6-phosphofructokinase 1
VVGIPKTIDNDIPFVARSFGFLTAVHEAAMVLQRAHTEARSVQNGIALVKLMGRHTGFLTAEATVASQDVNFTLVPEVPFQLDGQDGFLAALGQRIVNRGHAVIAVAEGAGQDLLGNTGKERDASGNVKLSDIGLFLHKKIEEWFLARKIPFVMRYFDPSYIVRSSPDNAEDTILCDQFARHAAHAAMAGKTGLVIGLLHDRFIHVPIELLATQQRRLDPDSPAWSAVLSATRQPHRFA